VLHQLDAALRNQPPLIRSVLTTTPLPALSRLRMTPVAVLWNC
jgi:hypothetical protein